MADVVGYLRITQRKAGGRGGAITHKKMEERKRRFIWKSGRRRVIQQRRVHRASVAGSVVLSLLPSFGGGNGVPSSSFLGGVKGLAMGRI